MSTAKDFPPRAGRRPVARAASGSRAQLSAQERDRLRELEETLSAIRAGQVDAILVEGAHEDVVYTLRGAETGYRTFLDEMSDGAATLTPAGICTYANARLAELLGRPASTVVGTRLAGFVVPEQRAAFEAHLEAAARGRQKQEFSLLRPRGTTLHALIALSSARLEGEMAIFLIISDLSFELVARLGPDGAVRDANLALEAASGRPLRELLGTSLADLFTEPDRARAWLARVRNHGPEREFPLTICDVSGRRLDVLCTATVFSGPAQDAVEIVVSARDVSERRRAEEAIRKAALYNRSLIEASLDLLVVIGPDRRISDVNRAAEEATGRSRAELIGTEFAEYFVDPATALAGHEKAFREGAVVGLELELLHKDGSVRSVLYNASVYRDPAGEIAGLIAAARDVTRRKAAEEALRASNRDLEQFAYVASHDLQQPLRMVASFVEKLAEDYGDKLDEMAMKYIRIASENSRRMQQLIQGLLAYSRLGSPDRALGLTSSAEAVRTALGNIHALVEEHRPEISLGSLPLVRADADRLVQVFQNLIGNAIKFRGAGRPQISVEAQREPRAWHFTVADNGIGIEPRHYDRIFAMFQRLHPHGKFEGTGIGLALCKRIVERWGGNIWVESRPGGGTIIHFTLPEFGESVP